MNQLRQARTEPGILKAATPDALPGYGTSGDLTVASGAVLAVPTAGWDSDDIDDLVANPSFDSGSLGIDVALGDSFTYASDVSGPIGLEKLGGGTLTLSGTNDYAGDTVIAEGTLVVYDGDLIPSGTGKGNVVIAADGTLDLNGQSITINGLSGDGTITSGVSGALTLTIGANDQSSTFSGAIEDGSGTLSVMKTGSGTLHLSGDRTYSGQTVLQNGTIALGALDSVFADCDEMTFNTKLDSAFRLAEPGSYGGSFELSDPETGGTLSVGSDGVISWTPGEDCAAGTYGVNATYFDGTNLQMKALSLTIEAVDLPPAFPFTDYNFSWINPPTASVGWENDEVLIDWQTVVMGYSFDRTFAAAGGTGAISYALTDDPCNLPPDADLNGATGEFTCTFSPTASKFQAYDFHIKATDSAGNWEVLHVVIPVSVYNGSYQGWPYLTPWARDADLEYTSWNQSQGYEEIPLYPSEYPEPVGYKDLVIDQAPAHGTLSAGAYWQDVDYTPTAGYHGLDSFAYHWVYDAYDNPGGTIIGQYSTNFGFIQIQVGSWVDLSPVQPYTTDTALIGVGGSTTVTLTLQNPRADGYMDGETWVRCPTTGYWQLDPLPSSIRVYLADGTEVLPNSKFYDTVADTDQITLTVVGASAGQANLSATWHVWDCAYISGDLTPNWWFAAADATTVDVVGTDIEIAGLSHSDAHSDTVGGLVVRRFDGNEAPRQEITMSVTNAPDGWNGNVELTKNGGISVYLSADSTTPLLFDGVHNVFARNVLATTPLYVQGDSASGTMCDDSLTLRLQGATKGGDSVKYTVLWVNKPTVKLKPTDTVSADNSKRDTWYKDLTMYGPLGDPNGTYYLGGPREYGTVGGSLDWMGWGTEARAVVQPANFAYPGVVVMMGRDADIRRWFGDGTPMPDPIPKRFTTFQGADQFPPVEARAYTPALGNDPSSPEYRDDTPSGVGAIYDLDMPGFNREQAPPDQIRRFRANFKAFATVNIAGLNVRCSEITSYWVRFSIKQLGTLNPDNLWDVVHDVAGDNTAGFGTTNVSANLGRN